MKYHYLDSNDQPAGPVSLDEIRALATEGKVGADPMIREDGTKDWKSLSTVTKPTAPAGFKLPVASTLLGDFVATFVKHVSRFLSPGLVETSLRWARVVGHYAVLLGGALALIFTIIAAIRTNSFGVFLGGLGFVVALAVAQFTALRFLGSTDSLIANTPSRVSSLAFLECVGLLAILGALGVLLLGVTSAIQMGTAAPLIPALLTAVFWGFVGAIALHPELASVASGEGSAAEEAIGIVAFFFKAVLKIVPLFFGLLAVVGCVVLLVSIFAPRSQFAFALSSVLRVLPLPGMNEPGFMGAGAILAASLLPMLGYFVFLLVCLPLELCRAILSVPGKLDALRR